jgi:hypothetical protein
MKTGRRSVISGYVARLLNINVTETNQKVVPFPFGLSMAGRLPVFGIEPFFPVFQSNPAGMTTVAEASIKMAMVEEKPKYAIPTPAAALPMAVANQIMALVLVASSPSLLGDRWKIAVRLTAQ